MWQVYLVLCNDGTLYCGIAKDVEDRVRRHNGCGAGGGKYTRARRPVRLVWYSDPMETRAEATREELKIKKLTRLEKWDLIVGYNSPIGVV